ncbi:MAG: cation-transporting P-type ATPase [Alphaproteobacteria bacterium]|nr:cation-transporting P-type ATPase [Alphaproteobacteria bacterium]
MHTSGLTPSQVKSSRKKYGANILPQPRLKTAMDFLRDVFSDRLNLILLFLAFVFIVVAILGLGSMTEALGIILVLGLISTIDVVTGLRSQRYSRRLQDMASVRFCNVIRSGKIQNINVTDIVVGDVVLLHTGDTIHADGYLIDGAINVDNSVLNGETTKVHKTVIKNYKYNPRAKITGASYVDKNSLFAGATIQSGRGAMIVTRVGVHTENGKILRDVQTIDAPKTSLDIQLDRLATQISKFGLIGACIVAVCLIVVDIMNAGGMSQFLGQGWLNITASVLGILVIALTIIAAAVPEGLPLIVSLVISQNAREMVRHNVLAKYPNKIPEAGNIQILCTDKTGTLTSAKLMPVENFLGDGAALPFDAHTAPNDIFRRGIILNGGASYDADNNIVGGNSTGRALLTLIAPDDAIFSDLSDNYIKVAELPFDSANKYSATQLVARDKKSDAMTYYMGAPEMILAHATHYMTQDGHRHKLNVNTIKKLMSDNASRAMRLVATAISNKPISKNGLPDDLTLVCITSMRDEIRPGIQDAVRTMHNAHVQVIMITGDSLPTAIAIARDTGIMNSPDDIAVNATDLDKYSDAELLDVLPRLRVVARAVPSTKLKLVQIAQSAGQSIGMCGDGTNDAPALKLADVGFVMGSGTDVAKAAADIIITDDNFVSVVQAVSLGRTFLHNIKMFLRFQLPINIWLMIACLVFPLFLGHTAFWATQILIINIIMDSLNSLAFGGECAKPEYMHEPVVPKGAPLITPRGLRRVLWLCAGFALITCALYIPSLSRMFNTDTQMETARFVVLIFAAMLNGFNVRTNGLNPLRGISYNPMFWIISLIVFASTFVMVQFGGAMFHVTALTSQQWLVLLALSLLIIPWGMLSKIKR